MALYNMIRSFIRKDEGQDLVEYALLVTLIALACVVAINGASGAIQGVFANIVANLNG